jgi:hypothetical protein
MQVRLVPHADMSFSEWGTIAQHKRGHLHLRLPLATIVVDSARDEGLCDRFRADFRWRLRYECLDPISVKGSRTR